ncbi:MAG TPA: cytochrome c biogenesis protein ResB [Candidatus Thiothrix moscowensis]|uniref:cytochrome c biogenesis protein ResB n=1 Tax=unclassified Thiothrix TaxID=2636184 RepID=UPI0025E57F7A|nr:MULTISPECIES: cytochrome c biogenesis protein ResB [unclassified Thiothrix]HRJ53488.1 cytochrome c biogenesis protein ResB [Candidatus Thiothrix moscowensis]HRJ93567.1 cytochrome c biogenesis protein ResB [Candidatus Thiothrix moscowensis]
MKNTPSTSTRLINFLGSMNLAITLLVVVAIASIIGTILKQNQPYTDYQIKFGSFWFDLFRMLGLYDVYSAVWFLTILAFLVISIATCVGRNTPGVLRELRHFRENVQEKSLRAMKHQHNLTTHLPAAEAQSFAQRLLTNQGFRMRQKTADGHTVIAAMKGGSNHWGYWLTHIGIIVICLGGLMDSRLPLMVAEWQGKLTPETRNIPASDVPAISQLPATSFSYRGNVDIPEGNRANIIFLPMRDGYYVQHLPFEVEVKAFRVEHYSTGMPKSFESDLLIHDKDLPAPLEKTISVNHPLIYKGIALYQANFGDGGSEVKLRLHPFSTRYAAQDLDGKVFRDYNLTSSEQQFKLEVNDFRLFNINDMEDEAGKAIKKNIGPSVTFKLRDASGQAMEYQNYMNPVSIKGQNYYISGVRSTPAEPFRYLHIPVDAKGGIERFMRLLSNIQDAELVKKSAVETTRSSMQEATVQNPEVEKQVVESMIRLTMLFATKGADGITQEIAERFPQEKQESASEAFMKVLNASLRAVYVETLKQEGITSELSEADWQFFDDSILAIDKISAYGSPWFVQLSSFTQIEASGLQITRSPGKDVVYFGSAMLTIGVFLLFYVTHRRVWVWIKPLDNNQAEVVVAGSANRNQPEFELYFNSLQKTFQQAMVQEVQDVSSTGNN